MQSEGGWERRERRLCRQGPRAKDAAPPEAGRGQGSGPEPLRDLPAHTEAGDQRRTRSVCVVSCSVVLSWDLQGPRRSPPGPTLGTAHAGRPDVLTQSAAGARSAVAPRPS